MIGLAAAVAGVIAVPQQASATTGTTLYVNNLSSACTDAGSGTQVAPYCTIQAAANAAAAGDTVLIYGSTTGGGTYDYTTGIPYAGGVTIKNSGTAASPIIFKAAAGPYEISGGTDGLTIDGSDVEVSGADIVNASLAGFWIGGSQDTLDQDQTDTAGVPVYVGAGSGLTVERSFLTTTGGSAVEFAGGSTGAVLTTNAISVAGTNPKDYAVLVDATPNVDVTSNTIEDSGCGTGIGVINGSTGGTVENNIIAGTACPTATAASQHELLVDSTSSTSTTVGYNIYSTAEGTITPYSWDGTAYSTQATFATATGQGADDLVEPAISLGSTNAIPSGSPAIGSANPTAPGELPTDAYGNAWPSTPDRGAIDLEEFTGATVYADAYTAQQAETQLDLQGVAWGPTLDVSVDWGDGQTSGQSISAGIDQTTDYSDLIVDSHMYAKPGIYQVTVTLKDFTQTITRTATVTMTGSTYVPVAPTRILDTRNGTGTPKALIGPDGTISVNVTSGVTVPANLGTITAVVMNVTAVNPTGSGVITVYPDGGTLPTSSNLNFYAHENVPNLVTVKVGSDDKVDFNNGSGSSTDLLADVEGYYVESADGSYYLPNSPDRLLDTRNGTGATKAPVGANGTVALSVPDCDETISGNKVSATATAVAMNVTVVSPTANGLITVYPDQTAVPNASNLNYSTNETVANLVVVKVGADGKVDFRNTSKGTVELIADVEGCYSTALGTAFVPLNPVRVLDTRTGTGQLQQSEPSAYNDVSWDENDGPLGALLGATALTMNLTVTQPQANGFITAYPSVGVVNPPTASNVNFSAGETIPNLVMVATGYDGDSSNVALYDGSSAPTDLVVDLFGYFS